MAASDALNTTTGAAFIPTVVANQMLGALSSYLSLGRTVTKDTELTTVQVGETVNVPKRGVVTANSLAQNGSVTLQQPTATTIPVTLDSHYEVTVAELTYLKSVSQFNGAELDGYLEDGVIALAEQIESDIASLWASFPIQLDAGGSNPQIDLTNVRKSFVRQKVPKLATRYGYVSAGFYAKLLQQTAYITPATLPTEQVLESGASSRISGIDLFEGQLVVRSGSPGVDRNMFYTRNAMVLATRPQPLPEQGAGAIGANVIDGNGIALQVVKSYNATKLANQFTCHVVWGSAMLDDRQAIEMDSSY